MRLASWRATVTLLLAASAVRADPDSERTRDVTALLRALQSQDAQVRTAAAKRIGEFGYATIERVSRQSATLDEVANEVRAWWEAARGHARFDSRTSRWQLAPP